MPRPRRPPQFADSLARGDEGEDVLMGHVVMDNDITPAQCAQDWLDAHPGLGFTPDTVRGRPAPRRPAGLLACPAQ
jgi:hypothetical protein